jgi:hypothetical protein
VNNYIKLIPQRLLAKSTMAIKDLSNTGFIDFSTATATADQKAMYNYYAFGSPKPGTDEWYESGDIMPNSVDSFKYRWGFNGQQKEDDIAGEGNHNTALFWEYDTRLGRRWNLDPKPNVSLSSYATFENNPTLKVDILGDTVKVDLSVSTDRYWSRVYNRWAKSKQGKQILKDYGVGGKYEGININIGTGNMKGEAKTSAYSVNKETGERKKMGSADKVKDGYRLEFDVLLTNKRSVPFSMPFTVIQSLGVMVGIDNIAHEIQHLKMDHLSIRNSGSIGSETSQHIIMQNNNSNE